MTSIRALLGDLLNRQELPIDDVMRAHLTDDYRQRTDGEWASREQVAEHFAHLRVIVDSAAVHVHEELIDQGRYAERHTIVISKRDGSSVVQEVYAFGDLSRDGRFERLEETTLMLEGDEADRGIAGARA